MVVLVVVLVVVLAVVLAVVAVSVVLANHMIACQTYDYSVASCQTISNTCFLEVCTPGQPRLSKITFGIG